MQIPIHDVEEYRYNEFSAFSEFILFVFLQAVIDEIRCFILTMESITSDRM